MRTRISLQTRRTTCMGFTSRRAAWTRGVFTLPLRYKRLSSSQCSYRIKVWSLDESSGTWSLEDEWKVACCVRSCCSYLRAFVVSWQAHDAAISKIDWAHAEFGQIIATSSFDRTVRIWEQVQFAQETDMNGGGASSSASSGPNATCRWAERAVLTEAKGSVRAVQFAPHHFGLKLVRVAVIVYREYVC